MFNYDLSTSAGKQAFEKYLVMTIRNEVNSIIRQVIADRFSSTSLDVPTGLSKNDEQDYRLERLERATFKG